VIRVLLFQILNGDLVVKRTIARFIHAGRHVAGGSPVEGK
jgi:hypothetical protein